MVGWGPFQRRHRPSGEPTSEGTCPFFHQSRCGRSVIRPPFVTPPGSSRKKRPSAPPPGIKEETIRSIFPTAGTLPTLSLAMQVSPQVTLMISSNFLEMNMIDIGRPPPGKPRTSPGDTEVMRKRSIRVRSLCSRKELTDGTFMHDCLESILLIRL